MVSSGTEERAWSAGQGGDPPSLVYPSEAAEYLEYCAQFSVPHYNQDRDLLESIQWMATKVIKAWNISYMRKS